MAENSRGAVLIRAIESFILPDDAVIAKLDTIFTDDVTVWSPNVLAMGLADVAAHLAFRERAFSDVEIEVTSLGILGNKGFIEFVVAATFTGPFLVDDDVIVEPNGRQLLLGAAAIADFDGDKIKALRAYFDDASLLEQLFADKV